MGGELSQRIALFDWGQYFKTTARFWLNLQNAYDLELIEDETLAQIQSEVRPSA